MIIIYNNKPKNFIKVTKIEYITIKKELLQ